jgi:biofilm PGA synthesis N-glycosyltransferase PgaC
MGSLWTFILLWGVWLITPILVDGVDAVTRLVLVRRHRNDTEPEPIEDDGLPSMTVIVPAHNEAAVIDRCLKSIKCQDYPHDKLEVIVIDDGSTDGTADRAESHANNTHPDTGTIIRGQKIRVGAFKGRFVVIRNGHAGKAHALNTGIAESTGEILVNVDSDVVLEQHCLRAIAEAFLRNPEMGAATGNVEVEWDLVEARDRNGALVLDDEGLPTAKRLGPMERFLAKSQFLEYLASFRLGRAAQGEINTMYTLAGACSAFRRADFLKAAFYSNRTVSEDTDMTWALHRAGVKIGFIPRARVFLEPVTNWDELYGQRVRWARGQLEVAAINDDLIGEKTYGRLGRRELPKMLLMDHTLAFPRLVWTPLVLFFPLLGYSPALIAIALLALYAFYVIIEVVNVSAVFAIAEEDSRHRIERASWIVLALPVFRFVVFHFRFSGFLVALMEEQKWTVSGGMANANERLDVARLRYIQLVSSVIRGFTLSWAVLSRAILPLLPVVAFGLIEWLVKTFSTQRSS